MFADGLPSHEPSDVRSLAMSTTQIRSKVLENTRLFSKLELGVDASRDPDTFTFTDEAQLSSHLRSARRETLGNGIDI
jgi:hypothetical protein